MPFPPMPAQHRTSTSGHLLPPPLRAAAPRRGDVSSLSPGLSPTLSAAHEKHSPSLSPMPPQQQAHHNLSLNDKVSTSSSSPDASMAQHRAGGDTAAAAFPTERAADKFAAAGPFITKLYEMISDPANVCYLRWTSRGDAFVVTDVPGFESILPRYYKHQQMSSFVRQLNLYGFSKLLRNAPELDGEGGLGNGEVAFGSPLFKRGREDLIASIRRKKPESRARKAASNASGGGAQNAIVNGMEDSTSYSRSSSPVDGDSYSPPTPHAYALLQQKQLQQQQLQQQQQRNRRGSAVPQQQQQPMFSLPPSAASFLSTTSSVPPASLAAMPSMHPNASLPASTGISPSMMLAQHRMPATTASPSPVLQPTPMHLSHSGAPLAPQPHMSASPNPHATVVALQTVVSRLAMRVDELQRQVEHEARARSEMARMLDCVALWMAQQYGVSISPGSMLSAAVESATLGTAGPPGAHQPMAQQPPAQQQQQQQHRQHHQPQVQPHQTPLSAVLGLNSFEHQPQPPQHPLHQHQHQQRPQQQQQQQQQQQSGMPAVQANLFGDMSGLAALGEFEAGSARESTCPLDALFGSM